MSLWDCVDTCYVACGSKMMGGGVLVVLLVELCGFLGFSGFWVKPNVNVT